MIRFNENSIYVGYIKQLLQTFNLPTVRCYTDKTTLVDGCLYIKDNFIQKYNEQEKSFNPVIPYVFNKNILNYTKNLKVLNILYDSHTHEYLGEYLRFLRDYKKVNLMSMYNCFSNKSVSSLYVNIYEDNETLEEFKTEEHKYKIYCFPVKFFTKYTIAMSSSEPIEIMCGFYTKSFLDSRDITNGEINVARLTHTKVNQLTFNSPYVFDLLDDEVFKNKNLLNHEKDLKLFIKIPLSNNSSIVVLEGTYLNTNSRLPNKLTKKWENASNVTNYKKSVEVKEKVKVNGKIYPYTYATENNDLRYQYYSQDMDNPDLNDIQYLSSLQLLQLNSNVSFPLADRLIEYLVNNAIKKDEVISDNIERLQFELVRRKEEGFTNQFPLYNSEGNITSYTTGYTKTGISNFNYKGIWEDKYKAVLYDIAKETGLLNDKFDVIGYLDKDIEVKLGSDFDIYSKE